MIKRDYARRKLTQLLAELDQYTPGEFWRQMSRIAYGATGEPHAEELRGKVHQLTARLAGAMFAGGNGTVTAAEQIRALSHEVEELTAKRHADQITIHNLRQTIADQATRLDLLETRLAGEIARGGEQC